MNYLFTSESVSEGHPDKVADQISDAVLDEFLARDPQSKVACETLVTTGQVVLAGEIKSSAYVDLHEVVRRVIGEIGYNDSRIGFDAQSCGILSAIHEQSGDINRGVERSAPEEQGAGDQGMMFGYATNETPLYIPLTLALSHALLMSLADIRREGVDMTYLRPDAKSQVTVEYDENGRPARIDTIVVSTQHDEFIDAKTEGISQDEADRRMLDIISRDVRNILIPRTRETLPEDLRHLLDGNYTLHVNPTGKFVIGGPTAIQVSQAAKSSWTPTADTAHTAAAPSRAKTPPRSTARQHTPHVILPRTSWPQAWPTACSYRWPMQSAWPSR